MSSCMSGAHRDSWSPCSLPLWGNPTHWQQQLCSLEVGVRMLQHTAGYQGGLGGSVLTMRPRHDGHSWGSSSSNSILGDWHKLIAEEKYARQMPPFIHWFWCATPRPQLANPKKFRRAAMIHAQMCNMHGPGKVMIKNYFGIQQNLFHFIVFKWYIAKLMSSG